MPPAGGQPKWGWYAGDTNVTPAKALAIADVWAAVRVLADAASSLPLHVYRRTGEGRERVTSGKLFELARAPGARHLAGRPDQHPGRALGDLG